VNRGQGAVSGGQGVGARDGRALEWGAAAGVVDCYCTVTVMEGLVTVKLPEVPVIVTE
jgi:hypothetical protein